MKSRRILYVAYMYYGSTCVQRQRVFEELGHTCVPFDMQPYLMTSPRLYRAAIFRLKWGPPFWRLNRDLVAAARGQSYDMVWVDKGIWVTRETVQQLKAITGAPVFHYTPDPAYTYAPHRTRHFVRAMRHYDVVITTKLHEIDTYKQKGARHVLYMMQGFDPTLQRPMQLTPEEQQRLGSDVCFIGHAEPHYTECLQAAAEAAGPGLAVWGKWQRHLKGRPWLQQAWRGAGAWGEDYAKALSAARMALGLLSEYALDTHTTRTFEIPACGTMMLAERSDEHLSLFDEGKEAAFFSSPDELRDKVKYYLAHDDERERIAAAGRQRCLRDGYTYKDRFAKLFDEIDALGL